MHLTGQGVIASTSSMVVSSNDKLIDNRGVTTIDVADGAPSLRGSCTESFPKGMMRWRDGRKPTDCNDHERKEKGARWPPLSILNSTSQALWSAIINPRHYKSFEMETQKVTPLPFAGCAQAVPPCSSAISLTMASPRPVPCVPVDVSFR